MNSIRDQEGMIKRPQSTTTFMNNEHEQVARKGKNILRRLDRVSMANQPHPDLLHRRLLTIMDMLKGTRIIRALRMPNTKIPNRLVRTKVLALLPPATPLLVASAMMSASYDIAMIQTMESIVRQLCPIDFIWQLFQRLSRVDFQDLSVRRLRTGT